MCAGVQLPFAYRQERLCAGPWFNELLGLWIKTSILYAACYASSFTIFVTWPWSHDLRSTDMVTWQYTSFMKWILSCTRKNVITCYYYIVSLVNAGFFREKISWIESTPIVLVRPTNKPLLLEHACKFVIQSDDLSSYYDCAYHYDNELIIVMRECSLCASYTIMYLYIHYSIAIAYWIVPFMCSNRGGFSSHS